jgi:2-polyprenyl-3-methyl-5-hydroxy-6-metoxy-1,4-benzoquinol methylase
MDGPDLGLGWKNKRVRTVQAEREQVGALEHGEDGVTVDRRQSGSLRENEACFSSPAPEDPEDNTTEVTVLSREFQGQPAKTCELVRCRICSGGEHETFLEVRGYRIVRCRSCGLWFVNPQPTADELSQFYAKYDDGELWRSAEENFNRGIRQAILRFKRQGAVLDVGCGSGNFLRCMRGAGFSVTGIEPSKTGSQYGEAVQGVQIFNGRVEEYVLENPERRFDVVTLLNVLEHLTNPKETLLKLRDLMAPDAVVAVVVPDARFHALVGGVRRALGISDPYWLERPIGFLSGFKVPDHLTSFGPDTISLLLQRSGFRVPTIQNAPVIWNRQLHRDAAKLMMRLTFGAIHKVTLGRLLFGYSTLAIARPDPTFA